MTTLFKLRSQSTRSARVEFVEAFTVAAFIVSRLHLLFSWMEGYHECNGVLLMAEFGSSGCN
eukprot:1736785-Amphidinium_carterae.3